MTARMQQDLPAPVTVDARTTSFEEYSKAIQKLVFSTMLGHAKVIEWFREIMDAAETASIEQTKRSLCDWKMVALRIAPLFLHGAGACVQFALPFRSQEIARQAGQSLSAGANLLQGSVVSAAQGYSEADRVGYKLASDSARKMNDEWTRKAHDGRTEIDRILQVLRQADDERAQTMRAIARP